MVVCGAGDALLSKGEPFVLNRLRSLHTSWASLTAPSMFTSPAPCSNVLKPANGCAEYIKSALHMFGVKLGLACSSNATAPATMGADIDVPLKYIIRPLG